jgi:hypothetical protein
MNTERDSALACCLHSAAQWLERMHVEADTVAVVTIAPHASIGLWRPGQPMVRRLTTIQDDAAELLESAGPLAQQALERMDEPGRVAALEAVARGARLQLLLHPVNDEAALRLDDGRNSVELVSIAVERMAH